MLFESGQEPNDFTYLQEQLSAMGFRKDRDFEIHTYDFPYADRHRERNWKNLILTFPGTDPILKDERVLLVAHLDSISPVETTLAPGADDNATGAAGLLEAAISLRHHQFARTIHLTWFSGEEQSRQGSKHFVADYADWMPDIEAVINLELFGFDWDQDRCFEVHAGVLSGSQQIGTCLSSVIESYQLDLKFDFLDNASAYTVSDHESFWQRGVPAVMVIENFSYQPNLTCGMGGRNYHYHQTTDTLTYINEQTGFAIFYRQSSAAWRIWRNHSASASRKRQGYILPAMADTSSSHGSLRQQRSIRFGSTGKQAGD